MICGIPPMLVGQRQVSRRPPSTRRTWGKAKAGLVLWRWMLVLRPAAAGDREFYRPHEGGQGELLHRLQFDRFEYARLAPLFGKLAHHFESCVYGLNLVKGDLDEMQHPITRQVKQIVM